MKQVYILPSFERSIKKLDPRQKRLVAKSLDDLNEFVLTGEVPFGFRFKKINHDKYEFRVDIRLRIVVKAEGDIFHLVLAGSHDDVRRYLRKYR
ncbi:hypothetical protein ACFL2J_05860 [Candidatus Omnitrophota bacterium]